jgi:hypothetical protein
MTGGGILYGRALLARIISGVLWRRNGETMSPLHPRHAFMLECACLDVLMMIAAGGRW